MKKTHQSRLKGRIMLAIDLEEFPRVRGDPPTHPTSSGAEICPPGIEEMIPYLSKHFQPDYKSNH